MGDVPDHAWQRSSFSDAGGNNCVELAPLPSNHILIRESESPAAVITTSRAALRALVLDLRGGTTNTAQA
jgi:hypothetical protein